MNPASPKVYSLLCPFWLPKEWDLALHRRKSALFLNQGYPLGIEQEFEFTLPPEAQAVSVPEMMENKAAPLRWKIEWVKPGKGKLLASLHTELLRGELSSKETPQFQQQLRELLAATANAATFSSQPSR